MKRAAAAPRRPHWFAPIFDFLQNPRRPSGRRRSLCYDSAVMDGSLSTSDSASTAGARAALETLVLVGAGGDLAWRMLLPSLFFLELDGLLAPGFRIWAVSRDEEITDRFRARLWEALRRQPRTAAHASAEVAWSRFAARLNYVAADASDPTGLGGLVRAMGERAGRDALFYLATSPSSYGAICRGLQAAGLVGDGARVVLEKPIGRDLAGCRRINEAVAEVFSEGRILRIDHYLGKETVQNLIALRFANVLFEPLWNSRTIDHVQITIAETEGVGERWPYYDEYGALRDMVQNHLLQLLCLVAMEPPSDLDPDSVRSEKVKVLRSLRPIDRADAGRSTVRGQYAAGVIEGGAVRGYVDERGAPTDTETYVALRAEIDNWRWAGVPFFLRTGKRMPERRTEIVIQFRNVPHSIFAGESRADLVANQLVIRLQPQEDISLLVMNKAPGLARDGVRLEALPLSLSNGGGSPAGPRRIAYERLLLDALDGNSTLFVRRDEAEKAWEWVDGVAEAWRHAQIAPRPYAAGTWGPAGAYALTERSGRCWRD
jgi:glucose-6-phosphate 1-dehydrogenase